nr:CotH kinase family protein [Planctomycetota bacterium]
TNMREPGNLELAAEKIDIENYTSYMLLNIWGQNHDWPHNNWYAARPRREDGRWIFLSWDAEFGLGRNPGGWSSDTFNHVLSRNSSLSTIMSSLINSPDYAQYLIDELDRYLEGPLSPQNVITEIRRHKSAIEGDMIEECRMSGQSIGTWNANVRTLEVFAQRRGPAIRTAILNSARIPMPRARYTRPNAIELVDPVEIRIFGTRFTANTTVAFNDIPSPRAERISSRELLAVVPADMSLEGQPTITLADPVQGRFTSRELLEVTLVRPAPRVIRPDLGSEGGGDTITIEGENFTEGARVEFNGVPSPQVEAAGDTGEALSVVTPPGQGMVKVRVINTRPGDLPSTNELDFVYIPSEPESFLRGDCDGDGRHSISDGICILSYLFRGAQVGCPDSVDTDDSGSLGLTDAVYLLNWLFRLDPAPAAPFPDCGTDPTGDELDCPVGGSCG